MTTRLKPMSAAADAEDKTEKHPVTPGVPMPARELYGAMLLERGMAKEALAAFEAVMKKEPHRLGADDRRRQGRRKGRRYRQGARALRQAVALAGNADAVRTEIAEARAFVAKK